MQLRMQSSLLFHVHSLKERRNTSKNGIRFRFDRFRSRRHRSIRCSRSIANNRRRWTSREDLIGSLLLHMCFPHIVLTIIIYVYFTLSFQQQVNRSVNHSFSVSRFAACGNARIAERLPRNGSLGIQHRKEFDINKR